MCAIITRNKLIICLSIARTTNAERKSATHVCAQKVHSKYMSHPFTHLTNAQHFQVQVLDAAIPWLVVVHGVLKQSQVQQLLSPVQYTIYHHTLLPLAPHYLTSHSSPLGPTPSTITLSSPWPHTIYHHTLLPLAPHHLPSHSPPPGPTPSTITLSSPWPHTIYHHTLLPLAPHHLPSHSPPPGPTLSTITLFSSWPHTIYHHTLLPLAPHHLPSHSPPPGPTPSTITLSSPWPHTIYHHSSPLDPHHLPSHSLPLAPHHLPSHSPPPGPTPSTITPFSPWRHTILPITYNITFCSLLIPPNQTHKTSTLLLQLIFTCFTSFYHSCALFLPHTHTHPAQLTHTPTQLSSHTHPPSSAHTHTHPAQLTHTHPAQLTSTLTPLGHHLWKSLRVHRFLCQCYSPPYHPLEYGRHRGAHTIINELINDKYLINNRVTPVPTITDH